MRRERVGGRDQAPVGRGADGHAAARLEHPAHLGQEELDVAHVLQRLGADDEVERAVGERQRRVRLELDRVRAGSRARARSSATADTSASVSLSARIALDTAPSPHPRSRACRAGSSDASQAHRSGGGTRSSGTSSHSSSS